MAAEASRAGVDREDKFFTNPDLNRLTRWRRLLLSYVTEVPYDADLRIWLIALAECGDWDTGEIRCSHARMRDRFGYSIRTSQRRLADVRKHKLLGQFLFITHRGRGENDPSRYLILFPGEEPPGQGPATIAGGSCAATIAGGSNPAKPPAMVAAMESSSHNPSDNLLAREARDEKAELKPKEEKRDGGGAG